LCSEASITSNGFEGSSTEIALLDTATLAGCDIQRERERNPLLSTLHRSEGRNFMCTSHARQLAGGRRPHMVVVKGSPAEVLELCAYQLKHGRRRPLDDVERQRIHRANAEISGDALRVLGVAYRHMRQEMREEVPRSLTWVGLIGMADRIRDGTTTLVRSLRRAGVRPVMVTSDQPATATAVARAIGLSGGEPLVTVDVSQLVNGATDDLNELVTRAHVFARVDPAQKLRIVHALQRAGFIVGMTGDGVNDAPALKAANLGIVLGDSATDVAKEIAHIVVQDGRPDRLIEAILEGRGVYRNIQRSVDFLLATNLSETVAIAAGVTLGFGDVLTPRQLLWINLASDLWPSLALALEAPSPGLLEQAPRAPGVSIIDAARTKRLAREATLLAGGSLASFLCTASRTPGPHASTPAFLALTAGQLLHALSVRARDRSVDSQSSRHVDIAVCASILVQCVALAVPTLRRLLGVTPIGAVDATVAVAGAVGPTLLNRWNQRSVGQMP
jgi:Ca2+-transporting ATPase